MIQRSPAPVARTISTSQPRTVAPRTKKWGASAKPPAQEAVLFQQYFKSVGPRTYAVQVKRAGNGNHSFVLIEGKREEGSEEVKKHRIYVWSEDFAPFFKLLQEAVTFIKANPVPDDVKQKRDRFWNKQASDARGGNEPGFSGTGAKASPARAGVKAGFANPQTDRRTVQKPGVAVPAAVAIGPSKFAPRPAGGALRAVPPVKSTIARAKTTITPAQGNWSGRTSSGGGSRFAPRQPGSSGRASLAAAHG